jgi:hypothetical protein
MYWRQGRWRQERSFVYQVMRKNILQSKNFNYEN